MPLHRLQIQVLLIALRIVLSDGWVIRLPQSIHRRNPLGNRLYERSEEHTTEDNDPFLQTNNSNRTDDSSMIDNKAVRNKLRLAKAQAEIDRILATPDAPLDADAELSRVVSVVSDNTQNGAVANTVDSLESQVYAAVRAQDYATAAQHRQAIDAYHMEDALQVLQVNAAYYKAFSANDYEKMQELWLPDESVTCIHPSVPPVIGVRDVMASFQDLFANQARCRVEPSKIRIVVRGGTTAIITCEEKVYAKRPFIRGAPRAGKAELVNTLQTTNMFRRIDGAGKDGEGNTSHRWYLAHHHASWHAKSRVGRLALEQASKSTANQKSSSDSASSGKNSSPPVPEIKMDGILGISDFTKPVLRNEKPSNNGGNNGGGIEDFVDRTLKDFMSNNHNSDNGGEQQLPFIQIHRIEKDGGSNRNNKMQGDADSEEWTIEDDATDAAHTDEEDEDDDEDDDGPELQRQFTISPTTVWSSSSTPSPPNLLDDGPAAALFGKHQQQAAKQQRQNCIAVLRELAAAGTLSRLHKRVLLSDIITCVARKERSLVEVAYELLYQEPATTEAGGSSQTDRWEEDFAEQCRAFADELLEED